MKQQLYYPTTISKQIAWLAQFRHEFPTVAAGLGLTPEVIAETLNDVDWLLHGLRGLREPLVHLTKAVTAYNQRLQTGKGTEPMLPPPLVFPAAPSTPPPGPGALTRIFKMARRLKHTSGYERSLGLKLGIEANLFPQAESPAPTFKIQRVMGGPQPVVEGRFRRFGHTAVWLETQNEEGAWAPLGAGIFPGSLFRDERPLRTPGVPEYRRYRMRFWDEKPTGEWSPTVTVLVGE